MLREWCTYSAATWSCMTSINIQLDEGSTAALGQPSRVIDLMGDYIAIASCLKVKRARQAKQATCTQPKPGRSQTSLHYLT